MTTLTAIPYIFLISFFASSERERFFIDDTADEFLVSIVDLPILVDSTGTQTFEDIIKSSNEFAIYPGFKPNDYCVKCTYWVKIQLLVGNETGKKWMLEFYDQTIDSITAFFPDGEGAYTWSQTGDYLPFREKEFSHKNFEWLIDTDLKGQQNIYFKVRSHSYADIRIAIRTVNRFVYYSLNEYFLYGIFYGMIFIISLYNILIFFAIREKKYLLYTFYIISVGVYAMCVDGIAYQYLWPNWPQWNQIAFGSALFSIIFWSLLFSKHFLNTATRAPGLDKLLTGMLVVRTIIFVYAICFDHHIFEYRNIEVIPLTMIFYTSIHVWSRGYKPARFFVVAYGFLFLGFFVKALIYLSIIPHVILSYYALHFCFLLEMLFLTFALSDRVRILKTNRDRALKRTIAQQQENVKLKNKVNVELEEKIKERTKQLEEKTNLLAESNMRLIEKTKEVNRMNSTLGLDNWKLQKNVKEILQDRLINKNLTLEQFNNIFPDRLTCYRFIDKHKWDKGYSCSKCENEKFSKGKTRFSRRCSKCGYDESVTCNTIFHHIKFPLEKAFYILYVTNNQPNEYTLDELSVLLDLRRNTIWKFKKKIEDVHVEEKGRYQNTFKNLLFSDLVN